MFERFHRKTLTATAAALLAALGVGGAALAQSGNAAQTPSPAPTASQKSAAAVPGQESNAPENSATDTDNIQQGDQNAADDKAEGPESAGEKAGGAEKESATEQASGSEKANDDGPGGHADEPGAPNADHQAQGEE